VTPRATLPARDLARGPARLSIALGVTLAHNGVDLLADDAVLRLALPDRPAPTLARGPRIGVAAERERLWRFWLPDEPCVSAFRAHRPRRRATPAAGQQHQRGSAPGTLGR